MFGVMTILTVTVNWIMTTAEISAVCAYNPQ